MMGIIGGAIASMVFVTYMIKIGKFSKRMKGKSMHGRSSSTSTAEEEEECDDEKFV